MHNLSLVELVRGLREKRFSSVELVKHFLGRIESLDPQYNSFITLDRDRALEQACQADQQRAGGSAAPLLGVPIAHKDIFCTAGLKTSCGSRMLDSFISPYDATAVEKLREAGAICLGKTNMDEFAMGSSNETSYYGPVRNPWARDCVPGGSSGGSAAAVSARLVPGATATDTGGSIRQPAALCGLTGLKPTYGRVSRWGMIAFASSLDQGGTLTRSAEDAALLLQTMAGFDPRDSTSVDEPVPDYRAQLDENLTGLKVGVPRQYFEGLDEITAGPVREGMAELERQGAILVNIDLPHTHLAVPTYYVIAPAECSANLSRFDGVRYGHRCEDPTDLLDMYCRSRGEGFGNEVKRRILVGTYALSAGYYDAYYRKAQQTRHLIKRDFVDAFQQVDVLAGPTAPSTAFPIGAKQNPVAMYMEDVFTIASNLAGLPALSTPCGRVEGKPVGMQLIGNYFDEGRILQVAHQYQRATEYHRQAPADID